MIGSGIAGTVTTASGLIVPEDVINAAPIAASRTFTYDPDGRRRLVVARREWTRAIENFARLSLSNIAITLTCQQVKDRGDGQASCGRPMRREGEGFGCECSRIHPI